MQVLVLEAGARDKDKFVHIPAAFAKLFKSDSDWDYSTEPQKELDGREIYWPRGKVLGGSSAMNAMMWVRGFAADYDEWGHAADESWSYEHVQKYFTRIERGPLVISPQRSPRSSTAQWLTAIAECGYRTETANQECARRVLRDAGDAAQGGAVECRRRLPQTRTAQTEPAGDHRCDGHPRGGRGRSGRRRRVPARGTHPRRQGPPGSGALRRGDQLAAAADVVGYRRPRTSRRSRYRRGPPRTRGRAEPDGPPVRPGRLRCGRGHAVRGGEAEAAGELPDPTAGDADLQRRRGLRIRPQP